MARRRCHFAVAEPTDVNFINLHHISCFCKIAKEFSIKLIANNFDSCPPVEPQNRSSYFILITKTTPKESEGQASSFVSLSDSFRFLIAEIIWIICMIHLSIYIRNIIGKSI